MAIINGLNVFASGYDPQLEFMKSLTRENYTYEAKKVLTNFLESEGVIPTKEAIRSNFDNVIPDDWEKVHTIVEEILSSSTKEEIERLTTPILPRMYYKSKKWDKPVRVVVEADDESKQFKMKVFILKDCYYLAKEIEFCVLEGKSLAIDKSLCWYHIFTTLYGVWDKENKKFTKSLEYERGYFASICNLAEDLCDDEKRNEKDKEDFVDSFGFTGLPDFAKALENEPERVTEMAVKVGDFYVSIHESDEGLDYSIFDANYHLLDGGVITDPDITIQEALKQIIDDMGGGSTPPMAVDYERLSDETDEVAQADMEAGVKALQAAERPDRALDEGSVSQPDVGIVSEEALEEQLNITFVVAECTEFHNLGELHEGVVTMEEAIALWEDIPAERMNGIKSIGIECVDSSGETLDVDIVIGNKIDLVTLTYVPEIYENEQALDMIAQLIDHYPEMEIIGDIPEKIEQRLEALYEQNMDPADKLAAEIDAFMYDFNPYEYNDQVDDRQAQVNTISSDLQTGEAGYITSYLQEIVTQGAGTTEDQLKAQELISKIQEYKPLAKVEEMEEQNYNQIDNVLNNGFEQKKEEKEKEARGEDKSDKRPSLKKRLDEKKELVASEPERPAPEKNRNKNKGEEIN